MNILSSKENTAKIVGELTQEFVWDHREGFDNLYRNEVKSIKENGLEEYVPIMIPEKNFPVHVVNKGKIIKAIGIVATKLEDNSDCYMRADRITVQSKRGEGQHNNQVYLEGYLCARNDLGYLSSGEGIISFRIAIDMADREIYLPCVAWGENALYVDNLSPKAKIQIIGKIGYRTYMSKESKTHQIKRVISIYKISEKLDFYYEKIKM